MSKKLKVGDQVYVPCSRVKELENHPTALYKTKIVEINDRSVKVNLPNQQVSDLIASSFVHKDVGIMLITIGDLETEDSLLQPLTKSILQYCRLLMDDDTFVLSVRCRSLEELKKVWESYVRAYKYVIIIGHGSQQGIKFAVNDWGDSATLAETLKLKRLKKKHFISLGCQTGYKSFAEEISKAKYCEDFIAPFHSVHGAIASQFSQTYLANHILQGYTAMTSFKRAVSTVPGVSSFRLWIKGKLVESRA